MTERSDLKKKILVVITKSNWGGAQRYVHDLARHLKEDFDITVACGGTGELVERLTALGIRTLTIPGLARDVHPMQDLAVCIRLGRIIKKERPDVLHLNSSKIGVIGAILGRLIGIKRIIFTAHGWAWNEAPSLDSSYRRLGASPASSLTKSLLYRAQYKKAHATYLLHTTRWWLYITA